MNKTTHCANGFYAIHFACYNGDPEMIKLLVKYGSRLDVANKIGLSPMHVAAQADKAYPITYLWANDQDVDC